MVDHVIHPDPARAFYQEHIAATDDAAQDGCRFCAVAGNANLHSHAVTLRQILDRRDKFAAHCDELFGPGSEHLAHDSCVHHGRQFAKFQHVAQRHHQTRMQTVGSFAGGGERSANRTGIRIVSIVDNYDVIQFTGR